MKLYKNSNGVWAGTQADARKMCGKDYQTVDVPVDKPSLLRFLNANKVGAGADPYGEKAISTWFEETEHTEDIDKKALSYFRWGYDKLCTGQYDEGKTLIHQALEYHNESIRERANGH